MTHLRYLLILLATSFCLFVDGRNPSKSFKFEFAPNSTSLDIDYGNNSAVVSEFLAYIADLATKGKEPYAIVLSGETSLEGTHESNDEIARGRVYALHDLLGNTMNVSDSIVTAYAGIPWNWFREEISQSNLPQKEGVLKIIDGDDWLMDYYGGFTRDNRIFKIRWYDKTLWSYLEKNYFPRMRRGIIEFYTDDEEITVTPTKEISQSIIDIKNLPTDGKSNPEPPARKEKVNPGMQDDPSAKITVEKARRIIIDESGRVIIEDPVDIRTGSGTNEGQVTVTPQNSVTVSPGSPQEINIGPKGQPINPSNPSTEGNTHAKEIPTHKVNNPFDRPEAKNHLPLGHIKTNLVGWGLAVVNAGIEFNMARHFSFALPLYYSGWNYFKPTMKFRLFAAMPEFRYWSSKKNEGFFVGLHGGVALYNIATGGEFRYQNKPGTPALGGGISLGYRLPISRNHRWHLEFGIGAGAYSNNTEKIENRPDGILIDRTNKVYFGPDNASIAFS